MKKLVWKETGKKAKNKQNMHKKAERSDRATICSADDDLETCNCTVSIIVFWLLGFQENAWKLFQLNSWSKKKSIMYLFVRSYCFYFIISKHEIIKKSNSKQFIPE